MTKRALRPIERGVIHEILTHPILAGLNVIFGVVIGIVATMFHRDLTGSTPLIWFTDKPATDLVPNGPAITFWVVLLLFAGIMIMQALFSAEIRKLEADRLETLIVDAPPAKFFVDYDELFQGWVSYLDEISKPGALGTNRADADDTEASAKENGRAVTAVQEKVNDKEELLRVILEVVIGLAKSWDEPTGGENVKYRANVMMKIAKDKWTAAQEEAAHRVYTDEIDFEGVKAHAQVGLWVTAHYATSDEMVKGDKDSEVEPLLLLVDMEDNGNRTINLHGAPRALRDGEMKYVADTSEIWKDTPSSINKTVGEKIRNFYEGDEKARSVISLPLGLDGQVVGVLNVYRGSEGIMGSESRASNFSRIMGPIIREVAKIAGEIVVSD